MITFHPSHLEISVPVARALLAFASRDKTRPHLCAVAVTETGLAATDGHAAVLFDGSTVIDGAPTWSIDGRVWSRAEVETALKRAVAEKRSVRLAYSAMLPDVKPPPMRQVLPHDGIAGNDTYVGVDPRFLAALKAVATACGERGVRLTALRGALDPIGFRCSSVSSSRLEARAAIMPMRI